jgi:hypothetical protein
VFLPSYCEENVRTLRFLPSVRTAKKALRFFADAAVSPLRQKKTALARKP